MADNPPYLSNPGTLTKALERIRSAATPDRFTIDFVSTVLGFKGGNGAVLPAFFKRIGFVNGDGTPTEIYKQFRNPSSSKVAAARAVRVGYKALYDRNEYVHKASDEALKGIIVEATGLSIDSPVVQLICRTFKNLKAFCDFDSKGDPADSDRDDEAEKLGESEAPAGTRGNGDSKRLGLNLAYSINLHLPATDDIKVFDAIFKSLKENLLKE
jgi:hypothetical protein